MDFEKLVFLYEELERTSSGNEMREILSEFFKEVPPEEIKIVAYLTLGQIASEYEGITLGIAEKMVLKAISLASGKNLLKIRKILQEKGDAGLVAEEIMENKPRTLISLEKLTIQELFFSLHKIARASGKGSQEIKIRILRNLLQRTSPLGAKYIVRITLGTLRLGVGDMTILDGLALAFTGEKKKRELLERAYNLCPDVGIIAEILACQGLKGIKKIKVNVGRPIKMMLCQRVKTLEEIPEKIPGEIAIEEKYDGERIQIHKTKEKIFLFSRRMENITEQFPDVIRYLERQVKGKEYILEGEVVAINEEGNLLPFQVLMQRRRKYEIKKYVKRIPVCLYLFDLLYFNQQSYVRSPYLERTSLLRNIVKEGRQLKLAQRILTYRIEEIREFFNQSLKRGCEGIIAKSTAKESFYQAGTRGWLWIKWKKEYVKEMHDTFDLVIVGAFMGKGKRTGTYGALLLAAYNKEEDILETVTKCGSGFTDEVLEDLLQKLTPCLIAHKPARVKVRKEMEPDLWFEPEIVVEVLGAEITRSPVHTCAVREGKGLAIRFPRFVRFREDRKPEQATTSKEIEEIYRGNKKSQRK